MGQDNGTLRVAAREAAARLGVSEAAIEKRTRPSTSGKRLGEDARVYVYPELSHHKSHLESQVGRDLLVEDLREQVYYLRFVLDEEWEANWENRRVIADQVQQIPELEPPQ